MAEQVIEDETHLRGNSQKVGEFGEEYENRLSIPQSEEVTKKVRQKLYLEGVALVDGVYRAVVNDEIVRVGSVIEDCEILGISPQGVIVEYDGHWVWIPLGAKRHMGD